MRDKTKFASRTIAAAASAIYGRGDLATDSASTANMMTDYNVHTVEITSAGAAVATITFNLGGGYGSAQTLTLTGAGTISQPYYMPGCVAIKVAIATTDCTVIVDSREV